MKWAEWEKCRGDHSSVYSDGRASKQDLQNSRKPWVGFPLAKHHLCDVFMCKERNERMLPSAAAATAALKALLLAGCFLYTYHCVGCLHFLLLVHHGTAAGGHMGVGWGTGRAGSWARGLLLDEVEGGGCPGQRHLHWSRRGHGETGGSCLRDDEKGEKKEDED